MPTKLEEIQNTLIDALRDQVENYVKLCTVNDEIIQKQKEYIKKLEELLEKSRELVNESLDLLGKNIG